jgi:hypothetical protein
MTPTVEQVLLAAHATERADRPRAMTLGALHERLGVLLKDTAATTLIMVRVKCPHDVKAIAWLTEITTDDDYGDIVLDGSTETDI